MKKVVLDTFLLQRLLTEKLTLIKVGSGPGRYACRQNWVSLLT
jgi:hypothetical protein